MLQTLPLIWMIQISHCKCVWNIRLYNVLSLGLNSVLFLLKWEHESFCFFKPPCCIKIILNVVIRKTVSRNKIRAVKRRTLFIIMRNPAEHFPSWWQKYTAVAICLKSPFATFSSSHWDKEKVTSHMIHLSFRRVVTSDLCSYLTSLANRVSAIISSTRSVWGGVEPQEVVWCVSSLLYLAVLSVGSGVWQGPPRGASPPSYLLPHVSLKCWGKVKCWRGCIMASSGCVLSGERAMRRCHMRSCKCGWIAAAVHGLHGRHKHQRKRYYSGWHCADAPWHNRI